MIDNFILNLCRLLISLENKKDKRFEKLLFLSKVQMILIRGNAERIHRDRFLLAVCNVSSMEVMADPFIAITSINHHDIGVLHQELGYNRVRTQTKEIGIICKLNLAFLASNVNRYRYALTIGVIDV